MRRSGNWIRYACALTATLPLVSATGQTRDTVLATTPVAIQSDSVNIRIVNTDLRTAVQMMQQYLDRPVVISGNASAMVTLETPRPVPRSSVLALLRGLLENNGFELVADTSGQLYRARSRQGQTGPFPGASPANSARPQSVVELFVLPLKHARASDVAATVSALYGREGPAPATTGRSPSLADELRANQMPPVGAPLPQAVPGVAGRSASLSGDVVIVPDTRANSLLVRSNRADFALVQAVVDQLDVRPLQVMIEVLIAEVRRNRSISLGVEATLGTTDIGKNGAKLEGGLTGPGLGDFALKVMSLGGLNLDATIRAAADRGDVKILSRPVVFTTNNEEAEIVVGTQRPFVQLTRSLPTDAAVRDQVVQYKEVGTKLRVRPTISVDGSVQLEVEQEVSGATNETAFNAPVISTRSVRTNLLIQDGHTVALGGLTDNQSERLRSGIPLLSSIPLLGSLFGHSTRSTGETELFIFLTPRVIRTDDDAARLSDALKQRTDKDHP